jgi:hypothetical protein
METDYSFFAAIGADAGGADVGVEVAAAAGAADPVALE